MKGIAKAIYNVSSPVPEPYEFERLLDGERFLEWLDEKWHLSIYISGIYAITIYGLYRYMEKRQPFELKLPLILWNSLLAAFSSVATLRGLPGFFHILKEFGFAFSLCDNIYGFRLQASAFWACLFAISKAVELGDTFFIVLRKRKLILLHWYHHIVTLIMVWYIPTFRVAIGHWTVIMNSFVHSLMYSYYALRAMRVSVPKFVAMSLTTLQIIQMAINVFLICYVRYLKKSGYYCHFPDTLYKFGFSIFPSYCLLFCHYFYKSYICRSSKQTLKKEN